MAFFIKKKRKSGENLFAKAKKLLPNLQKENIIAVFAFDLHPEISGKRVDGLVIADRETVTVFTDGVETAKLPLVNISSFSVYSGVGTVYVSYVWKNDQTSHMLCIGSMSCYKIVSECVSVSTV